MLIARLLPVIRTFIALPAGIARMPRLKFHVYTFVGSWPWCFALAYVGMRLGEQWDKDPRIKMWFHRMDGVILAVLIAGVAYFVWSHVQGPGAGRQRRCGELEAGASAGAQRGVGHRRWAWGARGFYKSIFATLATMRS